MSEECHGLRPLLVALVGVALADRVGVTTVLLVGAAMRLAVAALFHAHPVTRRPADQGPAPHRAESAPPSP